MLRPIEANLSIYNVEQKASQVKDANAHQFQAMQNEELVKAAQKQAQVVQTIEKPEGEVKVRDRQDDPEERRRRKRNRGKARDNGEDDSGTTQSDSHTPHPNNSGGSLDFLA